MKDSVISCGDWFVFVWHLLGRKLNFYSILVPTMKNIYNITLVKHVRQFLKKGKGILEGITAYFN